MQIYSTVVFLWGICFLYYKSVLCQPLLNEQPLGSLLQDKQIFSRVIKYVDEGNKKYSVKYRLWR